MFLVFTVFLYSKFVTMQDTLILYKIKLIIDFLMIYKKIHYLFYVSNIKNIINNNNDVDNNNNNNNNNQIEYTYNLKYKIKYEGEEKFT